MAKFQRVSKVGADYYVEGVSGAGCVVSAPKGIDPKAMRLILGAVRTPP
jgi:hypothetical protein